MNNIKGKFYALENASEIQNIANIINNSWRAWFEYDAKTKSYKLVTIDFHGIEDGLDGTPNTIAMPISKRVAKFFLNKRTLKGGLSMPMARLYAYKALQNYIEFGAHEEYYQYSDKWALEHGVNVHEVTLC